MEGPNVCQEATMAIIIPLFRVLIWRIFLLGLSRLMRVCLCSLGCHDLPRTLWESHALSSSALAVTSHCYILGVYMNKRILPNNVMKFVGIVVWILNLLCNVAENKTPKQHMLWWSIGDRNTLTILGSIINVSMYEIIFMYF